jgi:hypothetical protein
MRAQRGFVLGCALTGTLAGAAATRFVRVAEVQAFVGNSTAQG